MTSQERFERWHLDRFGYKTGANNDETFIYRSASDKWLVGSVVLAVLALPVWLLFSVDDAVMWVIH